MSKTENETINISRKYVSRKIKTIRWKPSTSLNKNASLFVTGSWGDDENNISVWHLNAVDGDPTLLQEILLSHDVNDIQYITRDLLAIGTGNGGVHLYQHVQSSFLEPIQVWEKCHKLRSGPVACTGLASNGEQLVSVGEDGKIFVFSPEENKILKIMDSECECSDNAVVFIKTSEVLTGNMQGHLKLWDLRAQNALKTTLLSPDHVSVKHISHHPTQQHVIAAAEEDGTLAIWDMRMVSQPLVLISAHTGPISEVHFHPTASDHMFSCGIDGKILHWDVSASSRAHTSGTSKHIKESEDFDLKAGISNAWLSEDVRQGLIDSVSLIPISRLPINSLNIDDEVLLAGSDSESVYCIKNIFI